MQQGRGGAFGVASEEKIFVAGGLNEKYKVSKKCEMYNVSTNEWQFIGSLNTWRVYGSMVCLNGTCFVLGGTKNNRDRLLSVECYDSAEDKWIEKASIPVERCAPGSKNTFTGCVMKLSRGVLEKPNFIKKEVIKPVPNNSGSLFATQSGSSYCIIPGTSIFNNSSVQSSQPTAAPVPVFELSDDDD